MCLRLPACVQKQQQQRRTASTTAKDAAASSAESVPSRAELREQYKELAPLKTNRKPKRVHIADYNLASKRGDGVSILVARASPHTHTHSAVHTLVRALTALCFLIAGDVVDALPELAGKVRAFGEQLAVLQSHSHSLRVHY